MSKKEKQKRDLRAAKYCADVALRRAAASKKMDHIVLGLLTGASVVFVWAVVLALVVG